LIYRYYQSASPQFISDRLEKDYGYDIVMLKKGDLIQGVNFYHLSKHKDGRWNRTNYILHFGQVMKRSGYRGNIIWTLGSWYARKKIGRAYLLQNVTGLASFISPKAFEHFTLLFPRHHYKPKTEREKSIRHFIVDYFNRTRGMSLHYNRDFCFDSPDLEQEDITKDWEKVYRAKDENINQFFVDSGIIKQENGRIYKMPRHITVCGIHRPIPFHKQLNLPSTIASKRVELINRESIWQPQKAS
ncbi:MAG: hypothetical protein AAFQ01_02695, partial [Bacteroidota bacterium]